MDRQQLYAISVHITYVSHTRFPTEKAHGHQVAQVCDALAELGHDITLITPTVWNPIKQSAFSYYGMHKTFDVKPLKHFDALRSPLVPGFLGFAVSMFCYRRKLVRYLSEFSADLFYVRSPIILKPLLATGKPVVLELHALPRYRKRKFVSLCNSCSLVVCLTTLMREELLEWGVDADRIIVEGDGVDPFRIVSRFTDSLKEKTEVWKLPSDVQIVGYVGSLITRDTLEKGVAELIEALSLLKERGEKCFGWIVGGPEEWKDRYERKARDLGLDKGDIRFEGMIHPLRVSSALTACDVCVYPAPDSDHPYFQRDTSPLKLFEYLASGRPIVCADIPPIRDVVDESIAHMCPPGDASALADAIEKALSQPITNDQRKQEIVDHYSWKKRMERIIEKAVSE